MGDSDDRPTDLKFVLFLSIFACFLVALVAAALTFPIATHRRYAENSENKIMVNGTKVVSDHVKAIKAVCQPTDYKEECVNSLEESTAKNTTDPKELIRAAFNVTINHIMNATKVSSALAQDVDDDPMARKALDGCKEMMKDAIEELQRSIQGFTEGFEAHKLDKTLGELETWLSATITYQETCLDGFQDVKGDIGDKMRAMLQSSMALSSNAIAIVTELSSVFEGLNLEGVSNLGGTQRRLLQHGYEDYTPLLDDRTRLFFGLILDPTSKLAKSQQMSNPLMENDETIDQKDYPERRRLSIFDEPMSYLTKTYGSIKNTIYELNRPPRDLLEEDRQIFVGLDDSSRVGSVGRRKLFHFDETYPKAKKIFDGPMSYLTKAYNSVKNTIYDLNSPPRHLLKENRKIFDGLDDESDSSRVSSAGRHRLLHYIPILEHNHVSMNPGRRRLLRTTKPSELKPDLVVAKDGSGQFTKINDALLHIPNKSNETTVIYVKAGVYNEIVDINKNMTHVYMIGDGGRKTRIIGNRNHVDGFPTWQTSTFSVQGEFFTAKNIGFENTAGPEKHQAVALRVNADHAIFHNCSMDGYQDTLYTHAKRQYYRDCTISGTIDFVFGDAAAVFQNCKFMIRKPLDNQRCMVTAQGRRDRHETTGIVIQNSQIVADPEYYPYRATIKSYLGRPWKNFSRTIVMESFIDDSIQIEGWLPWEGSVHGVYLHTDTCYYGEFENYGPGANTAGRVKWPGIKEITPRRARAFTAKRFINGDLWVSPSKVPYYPGFFDPGKGKKN